MDGLIDENVVLIIEGQKNQAKVSANDSMLMVWNIKSDFPSIKFWHFDKQTNKENLNKRVKKVQFFRIKTKNADRYFQICN